MNDEFRDDQDPTERALQDAERELMQSLDRILAEFRTIAGLRSKIFSLAGIDEDEKGEPVRCVVPGGPPSPQPPATQPLVNVTRAHSELFQHVATKLSQRVVTNARKVAAETPPLAKVIDELVRKWEH